MTEEVDSKIVSCFCRCFLFYLLCMLGIWKVLKIYVTSVSYNLHFDEKYINFAKIKSQKMKAQIFSSLI